MIEPIDGLIYREEPDHFPELESVPQYKKYEEFFQTKYRVYVQLDARLKTSSEQFKELIGLQELPDPVVRTSATSAAKKLHDERFEMIQKSRRTYEVYHQEIKQLKLRVATFVSDSRKRPNGALKSRPPNEAGISYTSDHA